MPHMDSNPFTVEAFIDASVVALFVIFVLICLASAGFFDSEDE